MTQIASYLGLPIAVIGGLLAGFFAWTKDLGILVSVLIIIFVITCVLQSLMAATFLVDRVLERRRQTDEENRAIAYQFAPAGAAIIRDETNEDAEFQLRVRLLNSSSFPLRYLVVSTKDLERTFETEIKTIEAEMAFCISVGFPVWSMAQSARS